MSGLTLDRYLRYEELTTQLRELAEARPDLVAVESIGRSHEGRDIWLATITDSATGSHADKPAHWIDGNIHATELTASVGALGVIDHLVSGHGTDTRITRALETRTFYVVPRLNPDGAELALADHPRWLRSSTRVWPWKERFDTPGLIPSDLTGDGRVLTMRIPDPTGAWKQHADDGRLMIPREMADGPQDGPYWRMLWEGEITEFDGFTIPVPREPEGLDLNRNFPAGWSTALGVAGDFPGSEPEIQALMQAIIARPNVCGYNAMHTYGGVLLRPSSTRSDSSLPAADVWTWTQLGAQGNAATGYSVHSVYEDFTWDRSQLLSGASDDWAYEHLGVFSWTTEFWDVVDRATGEHSATNSWIFGPTVDQELGVLRWADEHHPRMFVPWAPFEHPQLGPVDIGGWDHLRSWSNPPEGSRLVDEIRPHGSFAVTQALAAPCLVIAQTSATRLADDVWRIEVGVFNDGWLPTHVSEWGRKEHLVLPIVATLHLPGVDLAEGAAVIGGSARQELGQLAGRSASRFNYGWPNDGTADRLLASWVVRLPSTVTELPITVSHQRAGTVRTTVNLGD